jgi:nitroreductase
VITNRDLIVQIAEIACNQRWIARAPLVIVLCATCVSDERGGRDIQRDRLPHHAQAIAEMDQGLYWALNLEEHQTKIAGTHMALAALEHGVGSCWVSRFDVKQLAELLNLPEQCLPSEILVLGYPERERPPTQKKPLQEVAFHDTYAAGWP